jgi:hypothetical protein
MMSARAAPQGVRRARCMLGALAWAVASAMGCGDGIRGNTRAGDSTLQAAPGPLPPSAMSAPTDHSPALDTLRAVVARHRLTALPLLCLVFDRQDGSGLVTYDVRERHGGRCGGDSTTSPRLFSVAVDTVTWIVTTDARSRTAEMEPLSPRPTPGADRRP